VSLWWIAPAAVVVLGAVPLLFAVDRAATEVRELAEDVRRWETVSPSLAEARREAEGMRERLRSLRRR
jgi:hypothetical protein